MLDFTRTYWLSGSPCGGKTTVSDALAARFDWNVYHLDEHWESHKARAHPEQHPIFFEISRLTGESLWLRPLEEQIEREPKFVEDMYPLIIEDIEAFVTKDARPLLVDASVVPRNIATLIPSKKHIFYLIPTEAFQREMYAKRASIAPTLAKTSNPKLAWSNWMARDVAYARWLESQVREQGFSMILVDGSLSLEETAEIVGEHFLKGREGV
jgi:hypothetical protein